MVIGFYTTNALLQKQQFTIQSTPPMPSWRNFRRGISAQL
jgi:hypothetical protein